MSFLEIIITGYIINFISSIFLILFILIYIILNSKNSIGLMNKMNELQELQKKSSFKERNMDTIIFVFPFSGILKNYIIINYIIRFGLMSYIEEKIKILEKK